MNCSMAFLWHIRRLSASRESTRRSSTFCILYKYLKLSSMFNYQFVISYFACNKMNLLSSLQTFTESHCLKMLRLGTVFFSLTRFLPSIPLFLVPDIQKNLGKDVWRWRIGLCLFGDKFKYKQTISHGIWMYSSPKGSGGYGTHLFQGNFFLSSLVFFQS